jgi:hypothetical protein
MERSIRIESPLQGDPPAEVEGYQLRAQAYPVGGNPYGFSSAFPLFTSALFLLNISAIQGLLETRQQGSPFKLENRNILLWSL